MIKVKKKTLKGGNFLEQKYLFNRKFNNSLNKPHTSKLKTKSIKPMLINRSLESDKNVKTINISGESLSNVNKKIIEEII